MHTVIQQRPTHRKELSDDFFAINFTQSEQVLVDIDPDDRQQKNRRKKALSLASSPISTSHPVKSKKRALLITLLALLLLLIIIVILYIIFINEVVTRRLKPRIIRELSRQHDVAQNPCTFFTNENIKSIFNDKFYRDMIVTSSTVDASAGKDILRMAFVDNELYVLAGETPADPVMLDFLSDLTSNYNIPDVYFALHIGKVLPSEQNALLTMSYSSDRTLLVIANVTAAHIWETKERYKLNRIKQRYPFEQRRKVALFRGSFTRAAKPLKDTSTGKLLAFSLRFPELVDAKLTSCESCSDEEIIVLTKKGQLVDEKPTFENEVRYRYQIVLNEALSLKKLFEQTVIMSNDAMINRYDTHLTPYIHYVPLKEDLSDLAHQLKWISEYHNNAVEIASRTEDLADTLLGKECAMYNWKAMLDEYSKHQNVNVREVIRKDGWVHISPYKIYS